MTDSKSQVEKIFNKAVNLVSSSDIARMAGVTRGRVSQWRTMDVSRIKGLSPFPTEVAQGARGPLFDYEQVKKWLTDYGKAPRVQTSLENRRSDSNLKREQRLLADHVWNAVSLYASSRTASTPEDLRDDAKKRESIYRATIALAVVRALLPAVDQPTAADINDAFREFGLEPVRIISLIQKAFLNSPEQVDESGISHPRWHEMNPGFETLYQSICSAIDDLRDSGKGWLDALFRSGDVQVRILRSSYQTNSALTDLISSISTIVEADHIYSPVLGMGSLEFACGLKGKSAFKISGQDVDDLALGMAIVSAKELGIEIDVAVGDTIEGDGLPKVKADLVLADLPRIRPGSKGFHGIPISNVNSSRDTRWIFDSDHDHPVWLWIQHSISKIAPNGLGIITTPGDVLDGRGRNIQTRRALLESGYVAAIIELPNRVASYRNQVMWLLRGTPQPGSDIFLLDLETTWDRIGATNPTHDAVQDLANQVVAVLSQWWSDGKYIADSSIEIVGGAVSTSQLTQGNAEVLLRRRVNSMMSKGVKETKAEIRALWDSIFNAPKASLVPQNATFDTSDQLPMFQSISDLIRTRWIEIIRPEDASLFEDEDILITRQGKSLPQVSLWPRVGKLSVDEEIVMVIRISKMSVITAKYAAAFISDLLARKQTSMLRSAIDGLDLPILQNQTDQIAVTDLLATVEGELQKAREAVQRIEQLQSMILQAVNQGLVPKI